MGEGTKNISFLVSKRELIREEEEKRKRKKRKKEELRKVWIIVRFCIEFYGTVILYGKIMGIRFPQTKGLVKNSS